MRNPFFLLQDPFWKYVLYRRWHIIMFELKKNGDVSRTIFRFIRYNKHSRNWRWRRWTRKNRRENESHGVSKMYSRKGHREVSHWLPPARIPSFSSPPHPPPPHPLTHPFPSFSLGRTSKETILGSRTSLDCQFVRDGSPWTRVRFFSDGSAPWTWRNRKEERKTRKRRLEKDNNHDVEERGTLLMNLVLGRGSIMCPVKRYIGGIPTQPIIQPCFPHLLSSSLGRRPCLSFFFLF